MQKAVGDVTVRLLDLSTESDALIATLGAAFLDDPVVRHTFQKTSGMDDPETALRSTGLIFFHLADLAAAFGAVYTLSDHSCMAFWRPPGKAAIPWYNYVQKAPALLRVVGFSGTFHMMATYEGMEQRHALVAEPHWYLQTIGTLPSMQGKGRAKQMMAHHLKIVDEQNLPAYLEATKEANVPFYEKFGFKLLPDGILKIPDGPNVWLMWREKQS